MKNNCTTSNLKNGRESCGRYDVHNKSDTACSTISMRWMESGFKFWELKIVYALPDAKYKCEIWMIFLCELLLLGIYTGGVLARNSCYLSYRVVCSARAACIKINNWGKKTQTTSQEQRIAVSFYCLDLFTSGVGSRD